MTETIGVPLVAGRFCDHFGGAQQFMLCNVDSTSHEILDVKTLDTPPHKPGALPKWLGEHGVSTILAGSMGDRAQRMLTRLGIGVVPVRGGARPDDLVRDYLDGIISSGELRCSGSGHGYGHGHGRGHGDRCRHNH